MCRTFTILLALLSPLAVFARGATPAIGAPAAAPRNMSAREGAEFFEQHVRPVLVAQCYSCHSEREGKAKGGLKLDTRPGLAKGGDNGPVVVPSDPERSRLIEAIRWTDPHLQMPPKAKLSDRQIAAFEQWVKMGAPDPREATPSASATTVASKAIDIEAGRAWWAFQPVAAIEPPGVRDAKWSRTKVDRFLLAALEDKQLAPSPEADPRTLVQRASLDLTGLRATYEQVEAFAADPSPDAYERLIDELLASPHYGERWGRHWLDVARYAEDNPTGEATTPPYPFAWRYRDWVLKAVNDDVPYDRFVKLQLAADLMPGVPRSEYAALTFLGAGPVYHKDGRLSRDVVETLYTDDWDERVDTVTRGILGLSVACARCHDHKFDPVTTEDYHALMGVFASTAAAPRPLADVDPQTETRFMAASQQIFYLSYAANLLRGDPGSKPREAREKVERFTAEMERLRDEFAPLRDTHPEMVAYFDRLARLPDPYPDQPPRERRPERVADAAAAATGQGAQEQPRDRRRGGRRGGASTAPFVNAVYEAGVWVDGSDPDFTMPDVRPAQPRDMHVFPGGNVAKPGARVPRRFPAVLSKDETPFQRGSGRLELAERTFTDAAPLTARVIVNRVWGWHFGKPLVATTSDFGTQGERPTHPRLLDDLAARFIANGWSLKWLHREIMLSAAYRQASRPREDGLRVDPSNKLLWRMNPRRLDVEAFRDNLLQAAGTLDRTVGGASTNLEEPENNRRTVYGRVSRGRLSAVLQLYDFPSATMHSPGREETTTPLQQLFVLNSPFVQDQAKALLAGVAEEPDDAAKVRGVYRKVLARDPGEAELALALDYLKTGGASEFAHALLTTNEVIFWP